MSLDNLYPPMCCRYCVLDSSGSGISVRLYQTRLHDHIWRSRQQPSERGGSEPEIHRQSWRHRFGLGWRVIHPDYNWTVAKVALNFVQLLSNVFITFYRHIYWTDSGTNRIEVAKLDGRYRKWLIHTDLDQPAAIVVNPSLGYIKYVVLHS